MNEPLQSPLGGEESEGFDDNAALQRKFSIVAPISVTPGMRADLGLLSEKRKREERARRQRMRQQQMMSVHIGGLGHRRGTDGTRTIAVDAKTTASASPLAGSTADLPGHYVTREMTEPPPITNRINHTIVNYKGTQYLYGGRIGATGAAQYVQDVFYLAVSRQQWVPVSEEKNESGMGAAASRQRGKRDASNGKDADNDARTHPGRRGDHSAVVIGDEMYVFGGRRQQVPLDDLFAYNFVTDSWRAIENERQTGPGPTFNHAAEYSEATGRMYILGGVHFEQRRSLVFSWDVRFRYWRRWAGPSEVNPNELHRVSLVCRDGNLYVYGLQNSHREPVIYAMDENTGNWAELTTLGHPTASIGVLWNLVPPFYVAELGLWAFLCSDYSASTPTAPHVNGDDVEPDLVEPASTAPWAFGTAGGGRGHDAASTVSGSSFASRSQGPPSSSHTRPSVSIAATPSGGMGDPRSQSTFRKSSSAASPRSAGKSVLARSSTTRSDERVTDMGLSERQATTVSTSTRVPNSAIHQLSPQAKAASVHMMLYHFPTGVWSKITLHNAAGGGASARSSSAAAIFSRLLTPNASAFERKYAVTPIADSPAAFMIFGGTCDEDRIFIKCLPRKGLPPAMSSLSAVTLVGGSVLGPGSPGGGSAGGSFGGASGMFGQGSGRPTFSSAVAMESHRDTTGDIARRRQSSVFGGRAMSSFSVDSTGPQRSPTITKSSSSSRRRSAKPTSSGGGARRATAAASVAPAIRGVARSDGPAVIVVPYGPNSNVQHYLSDASGCPVAAMSKAQQQAWEEANYSAQCLWLSKQKEEMDASETAALKSHKRRKQREERDRSLASVVQGLRSSGPRAGRMGSAGSKDGLATEKDGGATEAASTAAEGSTMTKPSEDSSHRHDRRATVVLQQLKARQEKAEQARKAAYSRMATPLFRQKDIAMSNAQRGDRRFRTFLRWELLRRYVVSGGAVRDATMLQQTRSRTDGGVSTARDVAAHEADNPFAAVDELLWPGERTGTAPHHAKKKGRPTTPELDDGLHADDRREAVPTMASHIRTANATQLWGRTAGGGGRRMGSIQVVQPGSTGPPRALRPRPPAIARGAEATRPSLVASTMTLESVLQGDPVLDHRIRTPATARVTATAAPIPFSSQSYDM